MNRIETKIVIMITNRLAAAKESNAKTELIEELSENLYQRYLDLTAEGITEDDALNQTMDNLGDVKELLAYLKEESVQEISENVPTAEEIRMIEQAWEKEHAQEIRELENKLEAQIIEEMKPALERMEEEIKAEAAVVNMEEIHTVKVELRKGDIEVSILDSLKLVDICTENDNLDITEPEEGVLLIRQKVTKAPFLSRIIEKDTQVEIGLPARPWQRIELKTTSGDITLNPNLQCCVLEISSVNGDVEVWNAQADGIRLQTTNGDITGEVQCQNLFVNSVSGDMEINNTCLKSAELHSVSGDITANIVCEDILKAGTTSGDTEINFKVLPQKVSVSSISGDCTLIVPKDQSFSLQYKTVSGEFRTGDMVFNGIMKSKNGKLTYLDGGKSEVSMSSVSGDMEISAR